MRARHRDSHGVSAAARHVQSAVIPRRAPNTMAAAHTATIISDKAASAVHGHALVRHRSHCPKSPSRSIVPSPARGVGSRGIDVSTSGLGVARALHRVVRQEGFERVHDALPLYASALDLASFESIGRRLTTETALERAAPQTAGRERRRRIPPRRAARPLGRGIGQRLRARARLRDQPPESTNRGNVTHCSKNSRPMTLRGPVNGSGGMVSSLWPRP